MHRKCDNETKIWVLKMWKTSTYDLYCKPQAASLRKIRQTTI